VYWRRLGGRHVEFGCVCRVCRVWLGVYGLVGFVVCVGFGWVCSVWLSV